MFYMILGLAILLAAIAVIVTIVGGAVTLTMKIVELARSIKQEKLIRKMISSLQRSWPRFHVNTKYGVMAICTSPSLHEALAEHDWKILNKKAEVWNAVVVFAKPTFTFSDTRMTQRPIHTGSMKDLEDVLADHIKKVTGHGREGLTHEQFKRVASAICMHDPRLFVPYCGTVPNAKDQFTLYGKTTLDDFRKCFEC